jgi:hypothetical protein
MFPHPPQLTGSLWKSTHEPLQTASACVAHPAAHAALLHTAVVPEQTVPHAPQFAGSFAVLTHCVPQRVSPAGQPHLESPHVSLAPHAVVQEPQCCASLDVSTHAPPHGVSPAPHESAHTPTLQTWPAPQSSRHPPQLFGSVRRFTQTLLQDTSPGRVHGPLLAASPGPVSGVPVSGAPVSGVPIVASIAASVPPSSTDAVVSSLPHPGIAEAASPDVITNMASPAKRRTPFMAILRGEGYLPNVAHDRLRSVARSTTLPSSS